MCTAFVSSSPHLLEIYFDSGSQPSTRKLSSLRHFCGKVFLPMLKKISLAVLGLTIATLGARIVAWVTGDPRAPITSGRQIILIAIFFFVLVALTWVVETKALISFNWPWHRRRYFHEIAKVGTLG